MKIIAVTQRSDKMNSYNEDRDCLDKRWMTLLEACQLLPLIIPNHFIMAKMILGHIPIHGVLLTGGNDEQDRGLIEDYLITHCINNELPLLGVCHGMQAIQRYFGHNLIRVHGHVALDQAIQLRDNLIYRDSYHELGAYDTDDILNVIARAEDGVIKAIKHDTKPLAGIMWHPERCHPLQSFDLEFIRSFYNGVNLCEQLS